MSGSLISTMILILITWAFLYFIFVGLGVLIRRLFGLQIHGTETLLTSFWMGWAFTIFFLQLWHLLFRIDWRAIIFVSIGSVIGLLLNRKDFWRLIKQDLAKNRFFYFIMFLTALLLANRAILPPLHYDSGLYHFNSVRWITSFPIVPGLGNLHGRLAYNSPFFLYVSMLEIGIWTHKSHHLANGLLLLVLLAQIFSSGIKLFKNREGIQLHHIFYVLLFIPVSRHILDVSISSPSSDLSIFILGVVLSAQLLAFLENSTSTCKETDYSMFFLVTIAALGVIIKLNFLVLGTVGLLISIVWFNRGVNKENSRGKKTIIYFILVITLALIPWMIRGVILSGYIAYPISVGSFPVEWRIPHASVVNMMNWTRGLTRAWGVHYNKVLNNWDWIIPWAINTSRNWSEVLEPLLLALAGFFLILFCRITNKYDRNIQARIWLFLLPPVMSLVYWFITAPGVQYLGASLWILGVGLVALGIGCIKGLKSTGKLYIILFLYVALSLHFLPIQGKISFMKALIKEKNITKALREIHITKGWMTGPREMEGSSDIPKVALKTFQTNSGLVVYVPQKGDQCWDAPLPCTPYPHSNLYLRKEKDMRYGFSIYPKQENDPSVGMNPQIH